MVLPLYLAVAAEEMGGPLPARWGWMACCFDPEGSGPRELPEVLPPGAMLILSDRFPCRGHDPRKIIKALARLEPESVLLDFEREPEEDSRMVADALFEALPCPVAAPPGFIEDSGSPVFLPPCPLHVPLAEYLRPWQDRAIWLDVALRRQTVTVTRDGTVYSPAVPADRQGGVFDEVLMCQCVMELSEEEARFTLYDTPDTLTTKLAEAARLGTTRAVGLYQELKFKL